MGGVKKSLINTVLLFFEKWILLALNLLVVVLITHYLPVELVGTYSATVAFASLLLPFTTLGLNNLASKYFIKYPKSKNFYFSAALKMRIIGSLCAALIGSLLGIIIFGASYELKLVLILLFFQIFNAFNLVEYLFMSQQQVWKTMPYRVAIKIIVKILFLIALYFEFSLAILISIIGSEYLLIALCYWLIYKNSDVSHEQSFRKSYTTTIWRLFHKSKWLLISSFAIIVYLKIDQVMLSKMVGMEQTAHYAVAAKLSEFWYIFPVLLANAFNPLLTRSYNAGLAIFEKRCEIILSSLFLCAIIIALTMSFLADPLITILFSDKYQESTNILVIHIWACVFVFQRAIFSKWLILTNNYKFSLWTNLIGALANISLNLILIPVLGGVGAAIASLISYALAGFISLFAFTQTRSFAYLMTAAMLNCIPNCISLTLRKHKPYV